jgi:hypothetical protein
MEWLAIGSGIGTGITILIGYGVIWGRTKSAIEASTEKVSTLNTSLEKHHADLTIHIDPARDSRFIQRIINSQDEGFGRMGDWLQKIDRRCEERGMLCSNHFLRVERKIAAYTGKGNGGDEEGKQ